MVISAESCIVLILPNINVVVKFAIFVQLHPCRTLLSEPEHTADPKEMRTILEWDTPSLANGYL